MIQVLWHFKKVGSPRGYGWPIQMSNIHKNRREGWPKLRFVYLKLIDSVSPDWLLPILFVSHLHARNEIFKKCLFLFKEIKPRDINVYFWTLLVGGTFFHLLYVTTWLPQIYKTSQVTTNQFNSCFSFWFLRISEMHSI